VAEDSDLEKTESATPRRLEQAREDGQVARSRELATFALLAAGFGGLYAMGGSIGGQFFALFRGAFTFDRALGFDSTQMLHRAGVDGLQAATAIAPLWALMYCAALAAPMALGGWLLSTQAMAPKFGRLNPVAGIGRMFSSQGLVQLLMAIAKCVLVGGVALDVAWRHKDEILALGTESVDIALPHAVHLVGVICALIVGSMLLLVVADVPYQLWQHAKKLRMTKEEVRREHKENEGDPHIKGKIRAQQRAMARRRMMQQVPKADVIVTNPTHFAVALQYSEGAMAAPRVVAKGVGAVAARIREIGAEHNVPLLEAPPLARALYHHTDLNQEIPGALYGAVAEVLAWAYQLRHWRRAGRAEGAREPVAPSALAVPAGLDQTKAAS
jgi:flagellar biosynthetic protein FlhB